MGHAWFGAASAGGLDKPATEASNRARSNNFFRTGHLLRKPVHPSLEGACRWSLRAPHRARTYETAISAIFLPIASDAVAPGEGAFSTWMAFSLWTIRKSSTRAPLRSMAWARTPAPER